MSGEQPNFEEIKKLIESANTPRLQAEVRKRITEITDSKK